jgi:predicted AAA+ superfamily ATPase
MTIKQIEIKDFWRKFNIKWKLNPDVNILTGINGAGKSTLLDLIACIIIGSRLPKSMLEKASMIKIKFDEDEATIVNINFNDSYLNLTKKHKRMRYLRNCKKMLKMILLTQVGKVD